MRRIFKAIIIVFAVLILASAAFAAIVFLNLSALFATGSENLQPSGNSAGTAIVAYDPGLSGNAKTVAGKVAAELQVKGYTVTLAGIKSQAAANPSSYKIIVVGGPIYAGAPTNSVKDFLGSLNPASVSRVGVFGSGSGASAPEDIENIKNAIATLPNGASLSDAVVVKIGENEDLDARAADFANQLVG